MRQTSSSSSSCDERDAQTTVHKHVLQVRRLYFSHSTVILISVSLETRQAQWPASCTARMQFLTIDENCYKETPVDWEVK